MNGHRKSDKFYFNNNYFNNNFIKIMKYTLVTNQYVPFNE